MFRCEMCGVVSFPREKPKVLITEVRPKSYHEYGDYVAEGSEIVSEKRACMRCLEPKAELDLRASER